MFKRREKRIGAQQGKRRFDLPLNQDGGTGFLALLISLMTYLAFLALAASFGLGGIAERWATGLENHATVEIPAIDNKGTVLDSETVRKRTRKVYEVLRDHPSVTSAEILTQDDVKELISPWLGDNLSLHNVPVPGLISLSFHNIDSGTEAVLLKKIQIHAPNGRLDRHQSWLQDVLRFTGTLQFGAILLVFVITLTTTIAISGAVRSKISVHRPEVELLHLVGAPDKYISKQFQQYALTISFFGSLAGTLLGVISLAIIHWLSGELDTAMLPEFKLSLPQILVLAAIPVFAALIATLTSRQTVLRVLARMT